MCQTMMKSKANILKLSYAFIICVLQTAVSGICKIINQYPGRTIITQHMQPMTPRGRVNKYKVAAKATKKLALGK